MSLPPAQETPAINILDTNGAEEIHLFEPAGVPSARPDGGNAGLRNEPLAVGEPGEEDLQVAIDNLVHEVLNIKGLNTHERNKSYENKLVSALDKENIHNPESLVKFSIGECDIGKPSFERFKDVFHTGNLQFINANISLAIEVGNPNAESDPRVSFLVAYTLFSLSEYYARNRISSNVLATWDTIYKSMDLEAKKTRPDTDRIMDDPTERKKKLEEEIAELDKQLVTLEGEGWEHANRLLHALRAKKFLIESADTLLETKRFKTKISSTNLETQ
jgi:hypothetical protein